MHSTLAALLNRLDDPEVVENGVLPWGSPVPSFGDLSIAEIASLGLNPSNREFVDEEGNELDGSFRRFHTLRSLGLDAWAEADAGHLAEILASCREYFSRNPYDRWFRVLDRVLVGAGVSYYPGAPAVACHLDLIPYATSEKWAELTYQQKNALLRSAGRFLAFLLRDSQVRLLVLNGQSVVDHFSLISGESLQAVTKPTWTLPRRRGDGVVGIAYEGEVSSIARVPIGRSIRVLGFNHNLQSSFGVTSEVIARISRWVAVRASEPAA